jgi:iron(III) transport system ATP-binding protein
MADLRIAALTKAFGGTPILRGVELVVSSGSLVAILGASGSGKTTLLRLLSGFERADSGTIEIGGQQVSGPSLHIPPERRRIGYVAQEGSLFPHLTVGENVVFGLSRAERRNLVRAEALLESVGLPGSYAVRPPQELSGGEQQRVALARALAPGPKLVLLDEPFSALDAALRLETRQAVAAALAGAGATALLVTHDQSEALSMGVEVAVLRDGVLAQVGAPQELYRRPVDAPLAQFVGECVLLPGTASAGVAICALGRLQLAKPGADGPVEIMVRPEQIRFEPLARAGAVKAKVLTITFFGHDASVRMLLEAGAMEVKVRVAGHMAPEPGTEAWLTVDGVVMAYPCSPPLVEASLPLAGGQSLARPPKSAWRGAGSFGAWVRAQPQGAGPNAKI